MFTNETYRFGEGDSGQIGVKLSTEITKNVTVLILGGERNFIQTSTALII